MDSKQRLTSTQLSGIVRDKLFYIPILFALALVLNLRLIYAVTVYWTFKFFEQRKFKLAQILALIPIVLLIINLIPNANESRDTQKNWIAIILDNSLLILLLLYTLRAPMKPGMAYSAAALILMAAAIIYSRVDGRSVLHTLSLVPYSLAFTLGFLPTDLYRSDTDLSPRTALTLINLLRVWTKPMFSDIGGKIKVLAKVTCWIGIVASIIAGIYMVAFQGGMMVVFGVITLVFGPLLSWLASFTLYGFGTLVQNSDIIVRQTAPAGVEKEQPEQPIQEAPQPERVPEEPGNGTRRPWREAAQPKNWTQRPLHTPAQQEPDAAQEPEPESTQQAEEPVPQEPETEPEPAPPANP